MKKFIFTVTTFLTIVVCSAQNGIVQAEYFWDTDPGFGLATPVLATDGTFNSAYEQLNKTGIVLPSLGLHVFNIRLKDGASVWGPVFKNVISVQTTLGTADFELKNIVAYPNPVKDILNINLEQDITAVSLYNVLGQEIQKKSYGSKEITIDFSSLQSGTYYVKVTSANAIKTLKVVKE